MTVTVGTMALPVPEDADLVRTYLNGTHVSGGLWTALTRASNHDHTGGANGTPISVSSIPDGSITTGKLDPSVLLPYALVDGSKPFTGQVTMQADAVVRDALYFGQQGTALAPDVTLSRTGAGALRVDTHLGVGVNPAAWSATWPSLQIGREGALTSGSANNLVILGQNSKADTDGTIKPITGGAPAVRLLLSGGAANIDTAPAVAAGVVHNFTTRASIAPTGTLTLTPDAGQAALSVQEFIGNLGAPLELYAPGGTAVHPRLDNSLPIGSTNRRWSQAWVASGVISSSSAAVKEAITPLSPERAMQAVRDTEAVTFDYVAPTRGPEWYDLPDDPEQAEQVLQQRLIAAPLEAAARHQHGFVAEQADELFLVGEGQTSPGNSVGVLIAALQHIDARLTALEGA